jgi:hypothetical protein
VKLIWERIAGDFTPHFIASQLVIMALGMLPLKYWRGIQTRGRQISTDRAERLLRFDVSLQSWKLKRNSFMPRGGFDQGRIKHTNFEDETPGDTAWRLILSDNPTEIARVEAAYGRTQAQTVDDLLSIVAGVRLSRAMWAARAQLGNGFPLCAPIGTRLIERFIEGNM